MASRLDGKISYTLLSGVQHMDVELISINSICKGRCCYPTMANRLDGKISYTSLSGADGCGVDFNNFNNHLKDISVIGSLFRFHVYYQTRKIPFEMTVALS